MKWDFFFLKSSAIYPLYYGSLREYFGIGANWYLPCNCQVEGKWEVRHEKRKLPKKRFT